MTTREEKITVKAPDGKNIHCTIGYPTGKPKGMVLFVHGLASTEMWPTMLLGSWYFRKKGYAFCRINLYHWKKGARTLMTSDLLQHSRDTDAVAKYLRRKGFKNLFAVGHSFGGLTLLQADTTHYDALSLWDCSSLLSYPPRFWFRTQKKTGAVYMGGTYELLMSDRYIKGLTEFPNELELVSKITVPTQICYANGEGAVLVKSSKRYYQHVKAPKQLVGVARADHSFTVEGTEKRLFEKTDQWFRKHKKR